jgi:hypothetical protein
MSNLGLGAVIDLSPGHQVALLTVSVATCACAGSLLAAMCREQRVSVALCMDTGGNNWRGSTVRGTVMDMDSQAAISSGAMAVNAGTAVHSCLLIEQDSSVLIWSGVQIKPHGTLSRFAPVCHGHQE